MKATQDKPFTPVIMTLETQEEVDALFTFLNHRVSTELGLPSDTWKVLRPFRSEAAGALHKKLSLSLCL